MIGLGVLGIVAFIGITRFLCVKKEAQERFARYEKMAKAADISWGKVSYIEEGQGEVILICHGICGGYEQSCYDLRSGAAV